MAQKMIQHGGKSQRQDPSSMPLGKIGLGIPSKLGESLAAVQRHDVPPEDETTRSIESGQADCGRKSRDARPRRLRT